METCGQEHPCMEAENLCMVTIKRGGVRYLTIQEGHRTAYRKDCRHVFQNYFPIRSACVHECRTLLGCGALSGHYLSSASEEQHDGLVARSPNGHQGRCARRTPEYASREIHRNRRRQLYGQCHASIAETADTQRIS